MTEFDERVIDNPSTVKAAFAAVWVSVIGLELASDPDVLNSCNPSELLNEKAFAVPVSERKIRANPPLPV